MVVPTRDVRRAQKKDRSTTPEERSKTVDESERIELLRLIGKEERRHSAASRSESSVGQDLDMDVGQHAGKVALEALAALLGAEKDEADQTGGGKQPLFDDEVEGTPDEAAVGMRQERSVRHGQLAGFRRKPRFGFFPVGMEQRSHRRSTLQESRRPCKFSSRTPDLLLDRVPALLPAPI